MPFLLSESRLLPASLNGADFTGFMLIAVQRQTCLSFSYEKEPALFLFRFRALGHYWKKESKIS